MARFRPHIFFHDLLHHLILLLAILIFLWAALLSAIRLSLPLIKNHEQYLTQILNRSLHMHATFGELTITWHYLQPEIFIKNIHIWNDQHKLLMQIPAASGRIKIVDSLLKQELVFSRIQFNDWQLHLYQKADLSWQIAGIEDLDTKKSTDIELNTLFAYLLNIKHLQLQNATIFIRPNEYVNLTLRNLNMEWMVSGSQLNFFGHTTLDGYNLIPLAFAGDLSGNWFDSYDKKFSGLLYLKASPFDLTPWVLPGALAQIKWLHGDIDGELWAHWKNDHWQSITSKLRLQQLKIKTTNTPKIWQWQAQQCNGKIFWQADAKEKIWHFIFDTRKGDFIFGDLFRSKMPYQSWHAEGELEQKMHQTILMIPHSLLDTDDAHLKTQLRLTQTDKQSPVIQLSARAHFDSMNQTSHYLPVGIMPPALVAWLDQAILSGGPADVTARWHGSFDRFPYDDKSGELQINGKVSDIKLHFAPNWPTIDHLNANLFFTSHGMHIVADSGLLNNIPVGGTQADIPAFKAQSELNITSYLQSDFSVAWTFLTDSPLKKFLAALLTTTKAKGPFDLHLFLHIPLAHTIDQITYKGSLDLHNDQLDLSGLPIHLDALNGNLLFASQQFSGKITANWLSNPWHFEMMTSENLPGVQITAQGLLPLSAWLQQIAPYWASIVTGNTLTNLSIYIPGATNDPFNLTLDSNLQGITIHSPLGINKAVTDITPLHLQIIKKNLAPLNTQLKWKSAQGDFVLHNNSRLWQFSTPLGTGSVITPTEKNPVWQIYGKNINLQDWRGHLTQDLNSNLQLPDMDINMDDLFLSDNKIDKLLLQLRKDVNQTIIQKLVIIKPNFALNASGAWSLSDISQTKLKGQIKTPNLVEFFKMLDWPPIVETSKAKVEFNVSWPGNLWQFDQKKLSGQLSIATGQGIFTDISSATNNKINLGRILNLLSINAIGSHLKSRFNDLTARGFSFDELDGSFNLSPKTINPIHIQINGLVANVDLAGCVNRPQGQLSLVAQIKPKLTSSLPIIAAIAGGPVVGAFSFVADKLFSSTVSQIGSSYYLISGPFDNLMTKDIDRLNAHMMVNHCTLNTEPY